MTDASIRKRPRNLDLLSLISYRLPLPGRLSILHRVSGLGLFLLLGPLLWLFQLSVTSPEAFGYFQELASCWVAKVIFAGLIWAFMHHFCAGIRFLLLDAHVGIELAAARYSSIAVFVVSIVATVALCWRVLL
ncbi:MAG: succinate dehydrogenase, cytochrome b556 subunit [Zoogloeaceae bacterium]|nr:succinate dehydrogenase, cytochrome b556 subunit [Zoogloeaceae bacterium]